MRVSELYQWATVGDEVRVGALWNFRVFSRYAILPYADSPRTTRAIKAWTMRSGSRSATHISARSLQFLFQDVGEVSQVRRE